MEREINTGESLEDRRAFTAALYERQRQLATLVVTASEITTAQQQPARSELCQ